MIHPYLKELLKNFKDKDLKNFIAYVHGSLQKEIDVSKGKRKDKYIKIRKYILQYIVSNERIITSELRRNKNK